jgi:hypothetical protein
MEGKQNFGGEPIGQRPLGRVRRNLEDNIKTDFRGVGCGTGSDHVQCQALVTVVLKL